MKQLDLHQFNMYEKYGWVQDVLGEYDALDALIDNLPDSGNNFEKLISDAETNGGEQVDSEDYLAWYLEGNSGFDAVQFFSTIVDVESAVDELVIHHELDKVEPEPSYLELLQERNK